MNGIKEKAGVLRQLTEGGGKKWPLLLSGILLLGILLLGISGSHDSDKNRQTGEDEDLSPDWSLQEQELEAKAEAILGQVQGAGKVAVALTLAEGTESVYATDQENKNGSEQQQSSISITETDDGPVLLKEKLPKVQGVVILAEGADDPQVAQQLYQGAKSLLGLSGNQVAVLQMQREEKE